VCGDNRLQHVDERAGNEVAGTVHRCEHA
jgi:hypothetical protein